MPRIDVRRLAAVDMYGAAGSRIRRRVILAEFLLGAVIGSALGLFVLVATGGWMAVFGAWLLGACLNYVPLSLHALDLSRPGALERELRGVEVRAELRHYTKAQIWLFVPLVLVVLAIAQRRGLSNPG
ncbi:MAG TPA: hypothetical protein VH501_01145 [Solirubrobacterales bacterium]|jgi:hypothetical protein